MNKKKQSPSKSRGVEAYLRPKNYNLLISYSKINEISKSKAVDIAVKCFFENMPQDVKERIIRDRNND